MYRIYKKGNRKDSGNYRGININSILSRLFTTIIHNKLQETSKHIIRKDQNVFSPGRDCVDNLLIASNRKRNTKGRENTYDLEKAHIESI
jgi:hypothetical protein